MRPIDPLTLGIIEGSIPLMRHHLTFLFILVLVAASLLAYVISLPDARNESREIHTVRLEDHSPGFEHVGDGVLIILAGDDTYADMGFDKRTRGLHVGKFRYHSQGADRVPMLYLYDQTNILRTRIVRPANVFFQERTELPIE